MFSAIVGHILALGIGISLGLIGGGGSILAVPTLIYVMEIGAKEAIAMSLVIVGIVSIIGVIPHWLQGNVNFVTVFMFTPAAMLGAYLGAKIASLPFITETFQLISFGIVMLIASLLMIGKKDNLDFKKESNNLHLPKLVAIPIEGLGVGMLTGFVGVGGGFLIIPALVLLGGIPMKEAIGTSLLIIALKSVTGFLGYLNQVTIDWYLTSSFTLAASLGIVCGAYLTKFINGKQLEKGFGYFVLLVAVFVLIKR